MTNTYSNTDLFSLINIFPLCTDFMKKTPELCHGRNKSENSRLCLIPLLHFAKNVYSCGFRNRCSCVQKEMLFSVCMLRIKH